MFRWSAPKRRAARGLCDWSRRHLLLGASSRIEVLVVALFAALSRAAAITTARSDPARASRRRARWLRRSETSRVLPPATWKLLRATVVRARRTRRSTWQRSSAAGQLTCSLIKPRRDARTRVGRTRTRGATRSPAGLSAGSGAVPPVGGVVVPPPRDRSDAGRIGGHVAAGNSREDEILDSLDDPRRRGNGHLVTGQQGHPATRADGRDHRLEASRSGALVEREAQVAAVEGEAAKGGVVAPLASSRAAAPRRSRGRRAPGRRPRSPPRRASAGGRCACSS